MEATAISFMVLHETVVIKLRYHHTSRLIPNTIIMIGKRLGLCGQKNTENQEDPHVYLWIIYGLAQTAVLFVFLETPFNPLSSSES